MRQRDDLRLWLESYREMRAEELRLWRRHQQLRAQATRITTQYKDMPGGGAGDPGALLAALADEDTEALNMHSKARARRQEIESFIDELAEPLHRTILRLRYVECMQWLPLRFALQKAGYYYEERQIFEHHGAALKEARALWKQRKETDNG